MRHIHFSSPHSPHFHSSRSAIVFNVHQKSSYLSWRTLLLQPQIQEYYSMHPLVIPEYWKLARKHFRIQLPDARFVKRVNHVREAIKSQLINAKTKLQSMPKASKLTAKSLSSSFVPT